MPQNGELESQLAKSKGLVRIVEDVVQTDLEFLHPRMLQSTVDETDRIFWMSVAFTANNTAIAQGILLS